MSASKSSPRMTCASCRRTPDTRSIPNKNPAIRGGVHSNAASTSARDGTTESGRNTLIQIVWLAQHIATAPDGLDEIAAFGSVGELLAQLADEDVDDLQFRFVHATIEVVEEHFLGQRGALAERKQLQHLVFLACQMDALATDLDRLGIEVDHEIAGLDHRLGVALGAAHDRVDARNELVLVERLCHVVIGTDAETPDLVLDAGEAGEDQNGCLDLGDPKLLEHVITGHVRQVEVEQDDVVVVEFSEIDAFLAKIGRVDVEALGFEHQFDRLRDGAVIFYQQYAHASPL